MKASLSAKKNMNQNMDLPASELGTKPFWDLNYDEELKNFEDHGDVGEVWFGSGVTRKVVAWISEHCDRNCSILDMGCGNGFTLIQLAGRGFTHLCGIDYSDAAVCLAQKICQEKRLDIVFKVVDIMNGPEANESFDTIIDKGTFDAICLNPDVPLIECVNRYITFVRNSLQTGGLFIVTSCNWTKDELMSHFSSHFHMCDEISSSTFSFAGKEGSRVTTLIFKHK